MKTNNKLREALETLVDVVDAWKDHLPSAIREGEVSAALEKANAALAEPVKNCEVGTAEEQSKRLHDYCKSHRCLNCSSGNGDECKFYRPGMKTDCKIEWANAPYEEGGAK